MTVPEVNNAIKAFAWQEQRRNTFIASSFYKLPTLIACAILDSKKYPEPWEVYPDVFDEEKMKAERDRQAMLKQREMFLAWAKEINERN